MSKTKLQITKKFFKPNIFYGSPLVFKSKDLSLIKTRLSLLADIYENIFDKLVDFSDNKISSRELISTIQEYMTQIGVYNIDDILYTTNRSYVNGANQFMIKSCKFLFGTMSFENYMYFIDMMNSYYTYIYLELCDHNKYNF